MNVMSSFIMYNANFMFQFMGQTDDNIKRKKNNNE